MPQNLLPGLANLLAYPVEQGGVDQQRMQQWAVTQQMLQGLAQPPTGTTGEPPLTAEQIQQMNPRPQPSVFPGLIQEHPLAAGIPLRAVGAVGQVLQILSGARGGAEAPRPVGVKELLEMRRTQSLDAFKKQQAEEATKYRQDTLGERTRHDQAMEAKGKGGDEKPARTAQDELLRAGRAKGLQGQALADFVEEGSKPGPERDLDVLARQKFPNDPVKQAEWRETERIRLAGGKAALTGERRTAGQQLTAIKSSRVALGRNRQAIASILANSPPELLTQPLSVWLKQKEGDPAAIDARLAILSAPELAKAMGLTSRFNKTEFDLYAGALDPTKMTAKEYLATMDRLGSLMDDEEKQLRGGDVGGPQPGGQGSTSREQQLDDLLFK